MAEPSLSSAGFGCNDIIQFKGYKATDLVGGQPTFVNNDTVLTFKDGSVLTVAEESALVAGVDYFFV